MKTLLYMLVVVLTGTLITVTPALSDNSDDLELIGLEIDVNTAVSPELWIAFELNQLIDDGASLDANRTPDFHAGLRFKDSQNVFALTTTYRPTAIVCILDSSQIVGAVVEQIYDGRSEAWIQPNQDLKLVLRDGSVAVIPANTIIEFTRGRLRLTEAQRDILAEARATGRMDEQDRFDISKEVDNEDTASAEYIADFHFSQPLLESHFSLGVDGRLSTQKENPLNRMEIFLHRPLAQNALFDSALIYDLFLEANAEGTQTLDTSTLSIQIGAMALTPNLVKLTMGANRLRLKPVFTLGLNYVRHMRKQALYGHTTESFAVTLDVYYYIPVADKFALIYIGEGSYSNKRRIDDRLNVRNSITFAYDLPLQDLKAIFKWETGKNEFITDTEAQAMIGILMNHIPF